ncbi:unnamed protein product, partial [Allacma fusca]
MGRFHIALIVPLICLFSGALAQEKLTVSVFYETLCPDSIRFITTQLYPTFKRLGGIGNSYFNIDFVPYGKATCINEDGPGLLAANGNRTHNLNPELYYVPWILYNGQFNVSDLDESQKDFAGLLCKKLGSNGPKECSGNSANITVSVFYETLCPDSIRFITTQLFPTFLSFGGVGNPYFDIDFVPYGKATTIEGPNGTFTFQCQHGDAECQGNRVHACALKYYPETSAEAFVNCSMSSRNPPEAGPACAQTLRLDFAPIETCIENDGSALLAANGNRTHSLNPPLYFVPWILYNGVFSEYDLELSQSNF